MKKVYLLTILCAALLIGAPFAVHAVTAPYIVGGVDGSRTNSNWNTAGIRTIIVGWAGATGVAGDAQNHPVTVTVTSPTLGGQVVDQFVTTIARGDAQNVYGGNLDKGFNWVVPARFNTGTAYDFKFYASVDPADYAKYPIGFIKVTTSDGGLKGAVDRVSGKWVTGWAVDLDGDNLGTQTTAVMVNVDGEQVAMGLTGQERLDVQQYWNQHSFNAVGPNHGYSVNVNVPQKFRDGKVHTVHVFALEFTEGVIQQVGQTQYKTIDADGNFQ